VSLLLRAIEDECSSGDCAPDATALSSATILCGANSAAAAETPAAEIKLRREGFGISTAMVFLL
jgi:hypothetical protein